MSRAGVLLAATLLFLAAPIGARGETPAIVIDPVRTHGVREWWGLSLCWWAKIFGNRSDIADVRKKLPAHAIKTFEIENLGRQ